MTSASITHFFKSNPAPNRLRSRIIGKSPRIGPKNEHGTRDAFSSSEIRLSSWIATARAQRSTMLQILFAHGVVFQSSARSTLKPSLSVTWASPEMTVRSCSKLRRRNSAWIWPRMRADIATSLSSAQTEFLFNSEGFGPVAGLMTLFTTPSVRAFTVGELFKAIQRAQQPREQKHE
jgi:hypothetical protein